jgi:hypothetical protein
MGTRATRKPTQGAAKTKTGYQYYGQNRKSEKLIGIEDKKAPVTLVTNEASKLRRIASSKGKRDNGVPQERSD